MKTPEEIKKGLELHRSTLGCDNICPYDGWNAETGSCIQRLMKDTVEYIEHLESRLAQVERERDAAVAEIKRMECKTKELLETDIHDAIHRELPASDYLDFILQVDQICYYQFENEWRGVCEGNTKEEK